MGGSPFPGPGGEGGVTTFPGPGGGTPFPGPVGYPFSGPGGGYHLPRSRWGGTPFPGPGGYSLPRSRWGYPLPEQHSVYIYLLRGGRYASCVHAAGLSCSLFIYTDIMPLLPFISTSYEIHWRESCRTFTTISMVTTIESQTILLILSKIW